MNQLPRLHIDHNCKLSAEGLKPLILGFTDEQITAMNYRGYFPAIKYSKLIYPNTSYESHHKEPYLVHFDHPKCIRCECQEPAFHGDVCFMCRWNNIDNK